MTMFRIAILSVALISANGSPTAIGIHSTNAGVSQEKTKRDLPIIGPIPSSYRGQATGQTTFDGIEGGQLTLPADPSYVQSVLGPEDGQVMGIGDPRQGKKNVVVIPPSSEQWHRTNRAPEAQQGGFRTFQQFGQSFAPTPNFNQQPSAQTKFGTMLNRDRQQETTVDGIISSDLLLPLPTQGAQNGFLSAQRIAEDQQVNVNIRDDAVFDPETPAQRHDRLTNQYADVLTEYRSSLNKFNEELNSYSEAKEKRLLQGH